MADVKNSAFMVTAATVMIGAYGTDVFGLTPANDSVGMVKNVKISKESSTLDLTNGIQQNLVDSVQTGVKLSLGFEGYEFSARNFQLANGLAGTPLQYKRAVLTTALAAAGTSLSFATNPIPGETATGITAASDVPAGSLLLLQDPNQPDKVWPILTTANASGAAGAFTVTVPAAPAGMAFPVGATLWVANQIDMGSTANLDYFCVKVAGTMTNNNKPVIAVFPKVKITKGFDLSMSESAYGNFPFEISPYFLTGAEAIGRLAEIGTRVQGRLYVGG